VSTPKSLDSPGASAGEDADVCSLIDAALAPCSPACQPAQPLVAMM
jgi:hypothetical protein